MRTQVLLLSVLFSLVGCGGDDAEQTPTQIEFGGARPAYLEVPSTYDHTVAHPLLVVLHGYGANGFAQTRYTGVDALIEREGILLIAPDGTVNSDGKQFWNATDACCDFENTQVDDVAYISGLIEDISAVWNVDPNRVYVFGHSNGGFMSYRLACDRADLVAGIASLAGATWTDDARCTPSQAVNVLQIHGTADATIPFAGSGFHPSAQGTTDRWAGYDGCSTAAPEGLPSIDLDVLLPGDETAVQRYQGCPGTTDVQLWSIVGGGHLPAFGDQFARALWTWMSAHPRQ